MGRRAPGYWLWGRRLPLATSPRVFTRDRTTAALIIPGPSLERLSQATMRQWASITTPVWSTSATELFFGGCKRPPFMLLLLCLSNRPATPLRRRDCGLHVLDGS